MSGFMGGYKHHPAPGKARMRATFGRIRARASAQVRSNAAYKRAAGMNKAISNRAEKKHHETLLTENTFFDNSGAMISLSQINQGLLIDTRIGASIRPTSLKISFEVRASVTPAFVNICRILIFQYKEIDTTAAPANLPTVADILENTTVQNLRLYSPYRQDAVNTRVIYDRLFYVTSSINSQHRVKLVKTILTTLAPLRYVHGSLNG